MRDIRPAGKPKPPGGQMPPNVPSNLPSPKKQLYTKPEGAASRAKTRRPAFSGSKVPVAATPTPPEEYSEIPSPAKLSAGDEYRARHSTGKKHDKLAHRTSRQAHLGDKERKLIAILLVLVALVLGLAAFLFLPKASVTLTLQTAPLLLDQDLRLENVTMASAGIIPATAFIRDLTVQGSSPVQTREVVGTKASGVARIVNRTVDEQQIREQSRLVTEDGTLFYMQRHAIVPPNSALSVPIEAADAGEEGNIEPQRLDFAALDSSAQSIVYAEVDVALSGGSGEEVGVATANAIEQAKQDAGLSAREQVEQTIRAGLQSGFVLLEESWSSEISSFETTAQEGDRVEAIPFTANVRVSVFAFQEAALEQALQQALEDRLDENHMLFPEPISFTKTIKDINWEEETAIISVRVTHTTIPEFSLTTIQEKIAGRSAEEARGYLAGLPGVEGVTVDLAPFWAPRIPTIEQRILVDIVPDRQP